MFINPGDGNVKEPEARDDPTHQIRSLPHRKVHSIKMEWSDTNLWLRHSKVQPTFVAFEMVPWFKEGGHWFSEKHPGVFWTFWIFDQSNYSSCWLKAVPSLWIFLDDDHAQYVVACYNPLCQQTIINQQHLSSHCSCVNFGYDSDFLDFLNSPGSHLFIFYGSPRVRNLKGMISWCIGICPEKPFFGKAKRLQTRLPAAPNSPWKTATATQPGLANI